MLSLPHESLLRSIGREADALGLPAYLVGGAVRDALLRIESPDLDFVTEGAGSGIRLAEAVGEALGGYTVHVYENFGTAGVRVPETDDHPAPPGRSPASPGRSPELVLEFVGARKESYRGDSRKPIVEDATIEEDLARRDFTINALAVRLNEEHFGELLDPFGGMADIAEEMLRTPRDPRITFEDDPLRMLRAARFAAQLYLSVDEAALAAMREKAARVEILSQERITEELSKTLAAPVPSTGFKILFETGILDHIFPELAALQGVEAVGGQRHKDNFYHTLQVVDNLAEAQQEEGLEGPAEGKVLWLRWATLLHDIAKPDTKRFSRRQGWTFHGHEDLGARKHIPRIFKRLRLPLGETLNYVRKMVRLHHRPVALVDEEVTDSAVRRLLADAGEDLEDLMMLVRADITSKNPKRVRRYLKGFDRVEEKFAEVEARDRLRNFQPPVDGHEIMEMIGEGEGVAIGILKEWVLEAILEGEIPNEHGPARAYVEERIPEALRRGALFDEMLKSLSGPEKAAMGAIKEAVFWNSDLPEDHDEAIMALKRVKEQVLAEREER